MLNCIQTQTRVIQYKPKIYGFRIDEEEQIVLYSKIQSMLLKEPYDPEPYIPIRYVQKKTMSLDDIKNIEKLLGDIRWARIYVIDQAKIMTKLRDFGGEYQCVNEIEDTFIAHRHGPYGIGGRHDQTWGKIEDLILNERTERRKN